MIDLEAVKIALEEYQEVKITDKGLRVPTHCLYPSFEQVFVFCVKHGEEIIVHDGNGAARSAWIHGASEKNISHALRTKANQYGMEVSERQIRTRINGMDWLWAGVVSVANTSAQAAYASLGKIRKIREEQVIKKAREILLGNPELKRPTQMLDVKMGYNFIGSSGKMHRCEMLIKTGNKKILVSAVTPHPNSVAAKYLEFSDMEDPDVSKRLIYDPSLSPEDKNILGRVADLANFSQVEQSNGGVLVH